MYRDNDALIDKENAHFTLTIEIGKCERTIFIHELRRIIENKQVGAANE